MYSQTILRNLLRTCRTSDTYRWKLTYREWKVGEEGKKKKTNARKGDKKWERDGGKTNG